ncbi:MAG: hypothetical protein JXA89_03415 [Anaerolineae bacterium]|nr:hypothetical protein [Anaerolineae bacterium]
MQTKPRSFPKTIGLVAIFVILLVLPLLVRAATYYRGWYTPGEISRPDHTTADLPPVERAAFAEQDLKQGQGHVLIDYAHQNTVDEAELNLLLSRLTARGMDSVALNENDALPLALSDATALIVIAPHKAFTSDEIEATKAFVEQGGRVLLVADPSRYDWQTRYNEWGEYYVAVSDVAAINSLASAFELAFADDYLYNTANNAGNYQYINLTDFGEHPLTAGLEQVVFYSARSIASGPAPLILADADTTSSLSEQNGGLPVMSLDRDGQVLAVADLTFMLEPYNATADNNRLISNIADFVEGAERTYGLTEFPRFFGDEVAIVPMVDLIDPETLGAGEIEQLARLKTAFEATGRIGQLWGDDPDMDTIYIGLYGSVEFWPDVVEILAGQGISFTLETIAQERATPTPTPRFTATPTPTSEFPPLPTPTEEPLRDWIVFDGIAPVEAKNVALFYQDEHQGRQVLIVLAFSKEGLRDAGQRLITGNFDGCLLDEDRLADPDKASLALCPAAYEAPQIEFTPTPVDIEWDMTPTPPPDTVGQSILIVADDDGQGVYEWWTSAYKFEQAAYGAGYGALVWSTTLDGDVTLEQVQSYDAVIWCTGDFQEPEFNPETQDLDILLEYLDAGGRLILSGAFIGSPEDSETGLLLDIQVAQADHPLANGFEPGQIISLQRFTAESDYAPFVIQEPDTETIIFVRGPGSEFAGEAVITVSIEQDASLIENGRALLFGFPIFLLPEPEGSQLAGNAVYWLMEGL